MNEQLDLFSFYECDPTGATGVNIWYRESSRDFPDLNCEITSVKGQYLSFYVTNGAWDGRIDLANKTMTIFHPWDEDRVVPYYKYEFIYDKPEKSIDIDNILY